MTDPRRPTIRLHDVSVSRSTGSLGGADPDAVVAVDAVDAVVAAVREAVAAAAADGTPTPEGVRASVASSVASAAASSVDRGRP